MLYRLKNTSTEKLFVAYPSFQSLILNTRLEKDDDEYDYKSIWEIKSNSTQIDTGSVWLYTDNIPFFVCKSDSHDENGIIYTSLKVAEKSVYTPIIFEFEKNKDTDLFKIYSSNKREQLVAYDDKKGHHFPALVDVNHTDETNSWSLLKV